MKAKNLNTIINYRKRKGLDSQLGKIVYSTDIGIVDSECSGSQSKEISELKRQHPALVKFLSAQQIYVSHHLQIFVQRFKLGDYDRIFRTLKQARSQTNGGLNNFKNR